MLFHFSEDPNIREFTPRAPLAHPDAEPRVWAIDEWHSPLYFVPSECPRACFWPLAATTAADLHAMWPNKMTRMVIAIEHKWLERVRSVELTRYGFEPEMFVDCQDHGVFVADRAVVPVSITPLGPPLEALAAAGVELRLCSSLVPLAERLMATSFHWSLIRMRNAEGWNRPAGSPTMPVANS